MRQLLALLLLAAAPVFACDMEKPTLANMRAELIPDEGLWAYWFCADEYTLKWRGRLIKRGQITDVDAAAALAWANGGPADIFGRVADKPINDPELAVLREAMRAHMRTDKALIAAFPVWLVSKNGTAVDRPMYLPDGSGTTLRAPVGAVCNCAAAHVKTATQTRCPLQELIGTPTKPEVTACTRVMPQ